MGLQKRFGAFGDDDDHDEIEDDEDGNEWKTVKKNGKPNLNEKQRKKKNAALTERCKECDWSDEIIRDVAAAADASESDWLALSGSTAITRHDDYPQLRPHTTNNYSSVNKEDRDMKRIRVTTWCQHRAHREDDGDLRCFSAPCSEDDGAEERPGAECDTCVALVRGTGAPYNALLDGKGLPKFASKRAPENCTTQHYCNRLAQDELTSIRIPQTGARYLGCLKPNIPMHNCTIDLPMLRFALARRPSMLVSRPREWSPDGGDALGWSPLSHGPPLTTLRCDEIDVPDCPGEHQSLQHSRECPARAEIGVPNCLGHQ